MILTDFNIAAGGYALYYKEKGSTSSAGSGFRYLGHIAAEGVEPRRNPAADPITVNAYGEQMPLDYQHQGETHFLDFELMEPNRKAVQALVYDKADIYGRFPADLLPTGANRAGDEGVTRLPGLLCGATWGGEIKAVPYFGSAVPALNSNYETGGGLTIRWYKCCIMAPTSETRYALNTRLLTIPVSVQALPYHGSDNHVRFWEYTSSLGNI